MNSVRMGIVGAGRLGSFHAEKAAAHAQVDLIAVCDPSEENRNRVARTHGIKAYATPDELFNDVDAVVIAAPSTLHYPLGCDALTKGCHVLMEKPLVTSADEAFSLITLAERNKLVFQAGHVEQYNPGWLAAMEFLDDVRNGEPCFLHAKRTSGYTFRCVDIGAVLDLMIHDLELILSLIPAKVEAIDAFGFPVTGGLEDTAFASISFDNGSRARLDASRVAPETVREMTVYSQRQTVTVDFKLRTATRFAQNEAVRSGRFAPDRIPSDEIPHLVPTFMNDHFSTDVRTGPPVDALSLEMDDFVSAILRKTPSRVPAHRAGRAVELAQIIIHRMAKR